MALDQKRKIRKINENTLGVSVSRVDSSRTRKILRSMGIRLCKTYHEQMRSDEMTPVIVPFALSTGLHFLLIPGQATFMIFRSNLCQVSLTKSKIVRSICRVDTNRRSLHTRNARKMAFVLKINPLYALKYAFLYAKNANKRNPCLLLFFDAVISKDLLFIVIGDYIQI